MGKMCTSARWGLEIKIWWWFWFLTFYYYFARNFLAAGFWTFEVRDRGQPDQMEILLLFFCVMILICKHRECCFIIFDKYFFFFLWLQWTLEDSHPSREDRWQGQRWIEWGICSWRWSSFDWKFFNRSFVSKSQGCQQPKIVPFSMCFLSSVWNDVFMLSLIHIWRCRRRG